MALHPYMTFSTANRRLILLLVTSHLLWSSAIFALWASGRIFATAAPWWSVA